MFILMLFDIGQITLTSPRFGPAMSGLPSDSSFLKDFLHLNMSIPCLISSKFVWPRQILSADVLIELGGFCWDCLLFGEEVSGN